MLTVYFGNRRGLVVTATQVPVLPYILLFVTVLFINPVCRLVRIIKPFAPAEILLIFCMGLVSSGISTFGLSAQLVPFMSGLFNEAWNNDQSRWNQYVEPYMSEQFFVGEDGIQQASRRYLEAVNTAEADRQVYDAALRVTKAQQRIKDADAAMETVRRMTGDEAAKVMAGNRAQSAKSLAEGELSQAMLVWNSLAVARAGAPSDPASVVESFSARLAERDAAVQQTRGALGELESRAFEKVRVFRRGLPAGMRAYPGILPLVGEDGGTYLARVKRMTYGRRSWALLQKARDALASGTSPNALGPELEGALDALQPIREIDAIKLRRATIEESLVRVRGDSVQNQSQLDELHKKSRDLSGAEAEEIQSEIYELSGRLRSLNRTKTGLEVTAAALDTRMRAAECVELTVAALGEMQKALSAVDAAEAEKRLVELQGKYAQFDSSLRRFFVGDVPWAHWVKPLVRWGLLIGMTYIVLMAFNMLIFRQWAHNEKLIYPLAELTEHLAGASDEKAGVLPAVFKSGLFWAGFAVSASFLGWNLLCYSDLVPGLKLLDFKNYWKPFIEKSALQGLMPTARSEVFFTMVGLSFLIPKKISFSLWFFSVLYMLELLILVWSGYGVNESSFETEWWTILNFRTSQGGGALLVFAAVVLFKCRRYIACCIMPGSIRGLERDEQVELRVASFVFLVGCAGIVLLLWRGMGANLWYTIFVCLFILLLTVGLIRAVTEGGILGFQAWAGPFHFIRNVLGMDKAWTSPGLFAPLMVYYGVLFLDIKAFIAPAMANALKIRNDLRMRRLGFHMSILAAIAIAMVVGVLGEIMMSYAGGADEMNSWFHTSLPNSAGFGHVTSLMKSPPAADPTQIGWIAAGAVGMALLLYFRQFLFWLPHPIGLIMLVNPIMIVYWFSILLGWIGKTLVTKYGNKDVYARVRGLFLGLIAGELTIVALAMIVSYLADVHIPIDLNRNAQ